jgi:hypothetical protein
MSNYAQFALRPSLGVITKTLAILAMLATLAILTLSWTRLRTSPFFSLRPNSPQNSPYLGAEPYTHVPICRSYRFARPIGLKRVEGL